MSDADIFYLHVRVVEACNIPAADANGLSDPYVKIRLNGESKHRSPVCPRTLNPRWKYDTTFHLTREGRVAQNGSLSFELYDEDKLSKNDFLGQVVLPLEKVLEHTTVAGFFDFVDKSQAAKTRGELCVIITRGDEEIPVEDRRELLDDLNAQLENKMSKRRAREVAAIMAAEEAKAKLHAAKHGHKT